MISVHYIDIVVHLSFGCTLNPFVFLYIGPITMANYRTMFELFSTNISFAFIHISKRILPSWRQINLLFYNIVSYTVFL